MLTTAEVAALAKVEPDVVRAWILSGKLPAINVARSALGRRCYRIDPAEYAAFEARGRKAVTPPTGKPPLADVIEFF